MYQNNNRNNRNRTRSNTSSFKRKPSFKTGGFKNSEKNKAGFNRGSRFNFQKIDVSKFINKAIKAEESVPYIPVNLFSGFAIEEKLKANVLAKGYKNPTPIQDQAINHILNGSDVVGVANTGTGKTAAFLIPLINKVLLNKKENILIVVPTRELAIQINQEIVQFSRGMNIFSVCGVGGASIHRQIMDLRRSYNFIVGTPGRLKDLIERKCFNLAYFSTIVLDEADRMLDMGFIQDMRFLMSNMPDKRQTLFFSATLSYEINKLIGDFLRDPVKISVKSGDTAQNVDQDIIRVNRGDEKIEVLHDLLKQTDFAKVLIFGQTKHGVEKLSIELVRRGFKTESIHGDKNHSKRQRALKSFKENHAQVLVATDVAARGLDIPNVTHVINYDLPANYNDYVHRIGRTGRGENMGKAITFVI